MPHMTDFEQIVVFNFNLELYCVKWARDRCAMWRKCQYLTNISLIKRVCTETHT